MSVDTTREPVEYAIVSAQVPVETRLELERLARVNYRSLSGEIRAALTAHVARTHPDETKQPA